MLKKTQYTIRRFGPEGITAHTVDAITEIPLNIQLNGRDVVTLMCTGQHPRHLALGFLKSDALIQNVRDVLDVKTEVCPDRIMVRVQVAHDPWEHHTLQRSITSGCGKGTNFDNNVETISKRRLESDLTVRASDILRLVEELHGRSSLYRQTRGCHNASLCTPTKMEVFREDIGRHNAIDMLVGRCFEMDESTAGKMIVATGRVASEILLKIVRIGIPIMISTSVSTGFSVELARRTNLTLVGNVTRDSFWIYNDPGRIIT
ncbi:MAG: formate dehydrogenase accessory sulfurtransferase FdhD [Desulfovibrionaceae bacterium]